MRPSPQLTKSRFTTGLQCHKQLWWKVHEPDAPELVPDPRTQARFDQGTQVGELARSYVPGGRLVDAPRDQFGRRIVATRMAIAEEAPAIYEAAFSSGRVFAAVDILERLGEAFTLIEVKSSTSAKPEHVPDAAVQVWVLERAGVLVERAEIMHLNRECVFPQLGNLFEREDVTAQVRNYLPSVPDRVGSQLDMLAGDLPEVPIGPHCSEPYECPFKSRCWKGLPPHHVTTLYRVGRKAWDLVEAGHPTVPEVPETHCKGEIARRQRRAVRNDVRIVERSLRGALEALEPPLAFLDFETIGPAVPVWNGCHPYDAIPVQFSLHRQNGRGGYEHDAWLADGPGDPRRALAERLVESCRGAATVIAYNAVFERGCLERLAAALPGALAKSLRDVVTRLADLLPIVRDHVYDPAFEGSFGLKRVLPALVPELSYEGMDIAEGDLASVELERLLLRRDTLSDEEAERLRRSLLEYCERDTWGTVRLHERLLELAGGGSS